MSVPSQPSELTSLIWATNIDVLPPDRVVRRKDGYIVVRSPSNPDHWWGNLLIFDAPPGPGDGERWEGYFRAEFGGEPRIRHRTAAWYGAELGDAERELVARGYEIERTVGLVATPDGLRAHPRANEQVEVRALDPRGGADEGLWDQVVEIWVAGRDEQAESEELHRAYARTRLGDLRGMFAAGRGAWYVALLDGEVLGSCGVVVTGGRGRFQAVDTAAAHRRRGVCSRLVVDAGRDAAASHGARRLVICADPEYHARGLYEGLGFAPAEHAAGACRRPTA